MIVTSVTVYVKEEHIDDFIEATIKNHNGSLQEKGNIRFDFLQCSNDATRFMLYEAFESKEAVDAHKETAHYLEWKETVASWMAKPREGVPHTVISPKDRSKW